MLPSFVLSLREGLEAALIIGIALGALRKINRADLSPAVWRGAAAAAVVSLLAAFGLNLLNAEFEGAGEAIFEGFTMLLAAGILTWMIFWMARQARSMRRTIEAEVREASLTPGQRGLFFLAFFAVVREGIELALFLVAARISTDPAQTLIGAVAGLAGAAVLGWLLFTSTVRLNLRRFFQVTNVLLLLFAAGLAAHGVHELAEVGILPAIISPVWDTSALLSESSLPGQLLKALFGYNSDPTLIEVLAYGGYFLLMAVAVNLASRRSAAPAQATS